MSNGNSYELDKVIGWAEAPMSKPSKEAVSKDEHENAFSQEAENSETDTACTSIPSVPVNEDDMECNYADESEPICAKALEPTTLVALAPSDVTVADDNNTKCGHEIQDAFLSTLQNLSPICRPGFNGYCYDITPLQLNALKAMLIEAAKHEELNFYEIIQTVLELQQSWLERLNSASRGTASPNLEEFLEFVNQYI